MVHTICGDIWAKNYPKSDTLKENLAAGLKIEEFYQKIGIHDTRVLWKILNMKIE